MNIPEKLKELDLVAGDFIVVGGGILSALGIRDTSDIDLIVTDEVYAKYEANGWKPSPWSDRIVLRNDVFDVTTRWDGKSVTELLKTAQYVGDVPYLSLEDVIKWKSDMGREKDIRDLKLIEAYKKKK